MFTLCKMVLLPYQLPLSAITLLSFTKAAAIWRSPCGKEWGLAGGQRGAGASVQ